MGENNFHRSVARRGHDAAEIATVAKQQNVARVGAHEQTFFHPLKKHGMRPQKAQKKEKYI
jgi:hypothetical protein